MMSLRDLAMRAADRAFYECHAQAVRQRGTEKPMQLRGLGATVLDGGYARFE